MAAKKTNTYATEATRLANSKYSPVAAQIAANETSNRGAYDTGSSQRITALNAELGSNEAAYNAVQGKLGSLGAETGSMYQQAMAKSQSDYNARQERLNQSNSNMMSSLQSEMAARGLTMGSAGQSNMANNMAFGNNMNATLQGLQEGALSRQGAASQAMFGQLKGSSGILNTTAQSSARGAAQSALSELYNLFLQKKLELEGQKTVMEKEKGDYRVQTELTLKEQAEQKAAAKAQAKAQAAIAAGNLAFKYTNLDVKTQIEYDKMAKTTAQNDIANNLKERGFTHKQAMDIQNLALRQGAQNLDISKFNWEKVKPASGKTDEAIARILAAAVKE